MIFDLGDIVALVALFLAGYAAWRTIQFNNSQKSLIKNQDRLSQMLLKKEETETLEAGKADLMATIIRIGSSKRRLKIWNQGKAPAHNVQITNSGENNFLIDAEIKEKFPLEILEPFQAVELHAAFTMGTKLKHKVHLTWADEKSENSERIVFLTL